MTSDVEARLEAALRKADEGFHIGQCYGVTPFGACLCGRADCKKPGKHGGPGWMEQATRDPKLIRTRFVSGDPNYLVVPMAGSRLMVVDEDEPGSLETLGELPETLIVGTSVRAGGARGRHVYGRLPDGIDDDDVPYQWAGGEVRVGGNGGVVGPHSKHASGVTYDPITDLAIGTLSEAWVRKLIESGRKRTKAQDAAHGPDDPGWVVTGTSRHPWLASRAGSLRGLGLRGDVLRDGLRSLNATRCDPPKPESEVDEIAAWADTKEGDPGAGFDIGFESRPEPRDVGTSLPPADVDDWLIEGVLRPHALLLVASPEGLGKSYVRKEMAVRFTSCGGSLFGYYAVRLATVLEIDEENGEPEEYRREEQLFTALGVHRDEVVGYKSVSFTALNLGDEGSRLYLRGQVATHRPEVVMLDTGTSMVGEEWGAELKGAMRFLRSLSVRFGCAIVVFVHLVKPLRVGGKTARTHGTALSDVMGQWTRTVDAVALLADLGDGRANWRMFKKVPKSELVIVQADGLWKVVHIGAEHRLTTDDRVLRAIAAGGINPDDIAAALGVAKRTVSASIKRLRKAAMLETSYPYTLTAAGSEALP